MTLNELKASANSLRTVDLRKMNIYDSYQLTSREYPPQRYQSFAHITHSPITELDIRLFKEKAILNHAHCMTIDVYGLTAYVPVGQEIKI
jgi:hypothetical protein